MASERAHKIRKAILLKLEAASMDQWEAIARAVEPVRTTYPTTRLQRPPYEAFAEQFEDLIEDITKEMVAESPACPACGGINTTRYVQDLDAFKCMDGCGALFLLHHINSVQPGIRGVFVVQANEEGDDA